MTFWTRLSKVLFSKSSAMMTDGSEKRKRQLAFEIRSSRVFEKRSKSLSYYSKVKFSITKMIFLM